MFRLCLLLISKVFSMNGAYRKDRSRYPDVQQHLLWFWRIRCCGLLPHQRCLRLLYAKNMLLHIFLCTVLSRLVFEVLIGDSLRGRSLSCAHCSRSMNGCLRRWQSRKRYKRYMESARLGGDPGAAFLYLNRHTWGCWQSSAMQISMFIFAACLRMQCSIRLCYGK